MQTNLDPFTEAYVLAALWTFDENATSGDYEDSGRFEELFPKISPETLTKMQVDCLDFQEENKLWLEKAGDEKQNGHDFWLTRNHEGSGFWDREYPDDIEIVLREASQKNFKECSLYWGDDGLIYC